MASLEQRNGTFRLIVRFRGRRYSRSLRTTEQSTADSLRLRAEENLRRLELGIDVLPEGADLLTFLLSDGRQNARPEAPNGHATLGDLCDKFLASVNGDSLEATTRHCLNVHVRHFKRVLGPRFGVGRMTLAELQRYVDTRGQARGQRGKSLSRTTLKKEVATLNTIWRWGMASGLVSRPLPKMGLRFPKDDDKPPFQTIAEVERKTRLGTMTEVEIQELWDSVYLTVAEIEELLKHVQKRALHPCLYPMFATAAFTGARCSELRRSKLVDIDLEAGSMLIRERKRVPGRRSLRSVPISPRLGEVLLAWFKDHPGGQHTFCLHGVAKSRKPTTQPRPLTSEEARHHFRQSPIGTKWERLRGWHVFRHSFCSNCAAAGIDQRLIDGWVGHQTEDMRRRYRHLFPNRQQAAIARVFGGKVSKSKDASPAGQCDAQPHATSG